MENVLVMVNHYQSLLMADGVLGVNTRPVTVNVEGECNGELEHARIPSKYHAQSKCS